MIENPFTRKRVTPGLATLFILLAVSTSALMALATFLRVWRNLPGSSPYHLIDAAICVAVAIGIGLRWRRAAWAGLVYSLINTTSAVLRGRDLSFDRLSDLIWYALAIVSITLYPEWGSGNPGAESNASMTGEQ